MNIFTRAAQLIAVVVVTVLTVAVIGCDGNGGEAPETASPASQVTATVTAEPVVTPEPTPAPTPTPDLPPETGGMDGFRTFASQIEQAISNKDAQFFIDRARLTEFTCPGEPGLAPTACDGQPAGTVIEGLEAGYWRSEGQMVPPEEHPQWLERYFGGGRGDLSDPYGNGSVSLYAMAEPRIGVFSAVTTYIADDNPDATGYYEEPSRESRIFDFEFEDGRWQLVRELVELARIEPPWGWGDEGPPTPEWLSGDCTDCYDHWERWVGAP